MLAIASDGEFSGGGGCTFRINFISRKRVCVYVRPGESLKNEFSTKLNAKMQIFVNISLNYISVSLIVHLFI